MVLLFSLMSSIPRHLCCSRLQRSSRMYASSANDISSFKVAIVGGGYTGLACGYHLQQLFLNSTTPSKQLNLSFFAREPEPTGTIQGTWCASAVSAGLLVNGNLSQPTTKTPNKHLFTSNHILLPIIRTYLPDNPPSTHPSLCLSLPQHPITPRGKFMHDGLVSFHASVMLLQLVQSKYPDRSIYQDQVELVRPCFREQGNEFFDHQIFN